MVTIMTDKEKISGYGRSEEEALLNAYKNFFEGVIDKDVLANHLASALQKLKDSGSRAAKRPPRSSLLNNSIDKSTEKNKDSFMKTSSHNNTGLDLSIGPNRTSKGPLNDSVDDDDRKSQTNKSRSRIVGGRSYAEGEADRSRHNESGLGHIGNGGQPNYGASTTVTAAGRSKTPDRTLYVHEPHDCIYRYAHFTPGPSTRSTRRNLIN